MAASVLGELALLDVGRGRLRRAVELATEAVGDAELGTTVGTPSVGAELALGWVHLLWDDLGAAERHLDRAAAGADVAGDRGGRLAAAALWSLVRGSRGPRDAGAALAELRGRTIDLDAWQPPLALAPVLETAEARLLAARGDIEACAAPSSTGKRAGPESQRRSRCCGQGSRSPRAARRQRSRSLERRPEEQLTSFGLGIEAFVLTAVARHAVHDDEGAGEALENALALAGPNSYRRPFLDGGSAVQVLLEQRIRWGTAHRSFAGELLAAFRQRAPSVAVTRAELLEPLSGREQSVLRFLPTMMSNAEIAGELFVTSNTVKTHLKSIYRKLAVSRRRDAVERARALELL